MSENAPYHIPKAPGRWRAISLALVMHVALFLFFWIGIRWQNETPLTVEAEIWDPQFKEAAPLPTPPQPQPQPEPVVEPPKPQPEPQPEPKPAPPKVIDEPKVEQPDIALEKEKKRKQEQEKKAEQLKAQKEREKKEQAEKEQAAREKAEKQQAAKDKAEKEKTEREKKEKLEADKLKKAKEEKQKEDDAKKKAEADKQALDKKKQAADAKAAEARRQEDLKRMMGQATSSTGGSGTAEKSQGPKGNPDYANKLRAKIRSNTIFDVPGDLSGNPAVEYTVELFPDGTVRSVRNTRQSGVPGFDDAVRQAIMKSQPYPADKDGKVPSSFSFTHKPKDQ